MKASIPLISVCDSKLLFVLYLQLSNIALIRHEAEGNEESVTRKLQTHEHLSWIHALLDPEVRGRSR